jgi:Clostripain family
MNVTNEWTVMFVFAGDNLLSPSMVSQLKAIKDAGFQKNSTVLVYFDPSEIGAQTRLFEVNRKRKEKGKKKTQIGDENDPFVRNLVEDEITAQSLMASRGTEAKALGEALHNSDTLEASDALRTFLKFCLENHSAQHYMLFLVGHGMIVSGDAFLPDERPKTAIKLKELGCILKRFASKAKEINEKSKIELLGLHSCSMSAVEVVYELQDTASYMMATEGISYIGSWPYRQLLKGFFNNIEKGNVNVRQVLKRLYHCCLHNSTDYMFAGLSADLALLNLDGKKVSELTEPLQELSRALKGRLKDDRECARILLAHLKSQSYWDENYTDLYDFCACLSQMYDKKKESKNPIYVACQKVMRIMDPPHKANKSDKPHRANEFDKLVVFSDHFGPTYQYSHGLSIYFPWSRPIVDGKEDPMSKYEGYEFSNALKADSWYSFLDEYFKWTLRDTRLKEDKGSSSLDLQKRVEFANKIIFPNLSGASLALTDESLTKPNPAESGAKPNPAESGEKPNLSGAGLALIGESLTKANPAESGEKPNPAESGGGAYLSPSIKNHPKEISLSERASRAIKLNGR